jgi:hypothetical protein
MHRHFFTVWPAFYTSVHCAPPIPKCYVSKKQSRPYTVLRKSCSVGIAGLLMMSLTALGLGEGGRGGGEGVLWIVDLAHKKTFHVLNPASFNI